MTEDFNLGGNKKYSPLEPEEIFLDAAEDRNSFKLEQPLEERSLKFILSVMLLATLIFGGRLFSLQVSGYNDYKSLALGNMMREIYAAAPRGLITDRNNISLTVNIQSFDVVIFPGDFPKDEQEREKAVVLLAQLAGVDYNEVASYVFAALKPGSKSSRKILTNVSEKTAVAVKSRLSDLPGITVENSFYRKYTEPEIFSHVLGYVGLPTKEELRANKNILPFEETGKIGAELAFDGKLRGQVGVSKYEINAAGDLAKIASSTKPQAGENVTLAIDARMQEKLFNVMSRKFDEFGVKKGAAVVMDVKSGEILSLLSFPSYDNNVFVSSAFISDGAKLNKILTSPHKPLFNRAISGEYSPGSAVKPLVAIAALEEKIIDPKKNILVGESISVPNKYNPAIVYVFKDWKAHGWTDMRKAIAQSSNVYFYTVGGGYGDVEGLGAELLKYYFSQFGLGAKSGIEFNGEASGFIPDADWKKSRGGLWLIGDTYNMSIGQGDLLATPLQMARAVSVIANGGRMIKPTIVKKEENYSGGGSLFQEDNIRVVREGMRQAVTDGSARLLSDLSQNAAGKTGTAQVGGSVLPNAWFVGFAPYENPRISFAVIAENGGEGSAVAVPIARDFLEWYLALDNF